MATVDVDGSSHLPADSQPKSVGLVRGLAATRRSVCIHQMNWVNSRNGYDHNDSIINIIVVLLGCTAALARCGLLLQTEHGLSLFHDRDPCKNS